MNVRDTSSTQLTAIEECRRRSKSAWLHFPHIELLFLLFAFEGAVGSQAAALRRSLDASEPPWVVFAAIGALVRDVISCANVTSTIYKLVGAV